eukprot:3448595-Pyramimonas_sp.AAC.1
MEVERERRANYPNPDVHRQWCQGEGGASIAKLWIHTTTMRRGHGVIQKREPVSLDGTGYCIGQSASTLLR